MRVRIGPVTDRRLRPAQWRLLTDDERRALEAAAARPADGAGKGLGAARAAAGTVGPMPVRALRGATTLDADAPDHIRERVKALMAALYERNGLDNDQVISVVVTGTADITTFHPVTAARAFGLDDVPLLGAQELDDRRHAAPLRAGAAPRRDGPAPLGAAPRVPGGRGRPAPRPHGRLTMAGRSRGAVTADGATAA